MDYELQAKTENGAQLVALAETHAGDFASRAAEHDEAGDYAFENIVALLDSGYMYSPFPAEFGGLDVSLVHDVVVASSRLARGDAATTIGANMHLIAGLGVRRAYDTSKSRGKEDGVAAFGKAMELWTRERRVYAAAISEPNQDLTRPATTATRAEGGWRVSGTKVFATMSPAATHFNVGVTYTDEEGTERYAFAQVPADAPGVIFHDDWDALGMRASGSGSVTFDDVPVNSASMGRGFPAGVVNAELLDSFLVSGPLHAAASLGIAESADELVRAMITSKKGSHGRRPADRPTIQRLAAENLVELAAMRGILARAGDAIDGFYTANATNRGTLPDVAAALAQTQAAKAFINEASVRLVDRALTMSGGAGFMNKHPLSRHYRDARAGAFMHPFGANVVYDYLGQVAAGADISFT